jgi:hypothetical protein
VIQHCSCAECVRELGEIVPHAFVRGAETGPYRVGPPDTTCAVCCCEPGHRLHSVPDPAIPCSDPTRREHRFEHRLDRVCAYCGCAPDAPEHRVSDDVEKPATTVDDLQLIAQLVDILDRIGGYMSTEDQCALRAGKARVAEYAAFAAAAVLAATASLSPDDPTPGAIRSRLHLPDPTRPTR